MACTHTCSMPQHTRTTQTQASKEAQKTTASRARPALTGGQPQLLALVAAGVVLEVFHKLAAPRLDDLAGAAIPRPGSHMQGWKERRAGEAGGWKSGRWAGERPDAAGAMQDKHARRAARRHEHIKLHTQRRAHLTVMTASSKILCASLTSVVWWWQQ